MKQYEIWWAALPAPAGRRPVLMLTRDTAYEYLNTYVVAEITTRIRNIPQEVKLGRRDGLPASCVANFDSLRAVHRSWLERRITALPSSRIREVKRAVGYALGWPELTLDDG